MVFIHWACSDDAFPKRSRSSAKNKWEIYGLFCEVFNGFHRPWVTTSEIRCPNTSIQRTNKYGDKGSPCLKPRFGWNSLSCFPFYNTVRVVEDMHERINPVRCVLNSAARMTSWRKGHAILSYAFSKSTWSPCHLFSLFFFPTNESFCCAITILSIGCRPGTKLACCSPVSFGMRDFNVLANTSITNFINTLHKAMSLN